MNASLVDPNRNRLLGVHVDYFREGLPLDAERDCSAAISELLEESRFTVIDRDLGPYHLTIYNTGERLAFQVADHTRNPICLHLMSYRSLLRFVRDYEQICDVHVKAAAGSDLYRLEAIDMGRRAMHDEGSAFLQDRLSTKFAFDRQTARRLFTLIFVCLTRTRINSALALSAVR